MEFPSLARRMFSFLLDTIIVFIFFYLLYLFFESERMSGVIGAFYLITFFSYEPVLSTTCGTIGKNIFGIALRDRNDYTQKVGALRNYTRYFLKIFSILRIYPCFIYLYKNETPYDYVTGTVIIYKEYSKSNFIRHKIKSISNK